METTLTFRPFGPPAHLLQFVHQLVEKFSPLQVYLFGHTHKAEEINSTFSLFSLQKEEIYYLLVATRGCIRIENGIQEFAQATYTAGKAIVLAHGESAFQKNTSGNNHFFSKVINEGLLLYNHAGTLQVKERVACPAPAKVLETANTHLLHRSQMAKGFFKAAEEALNSKHFNVCVFLLHQTVEQTCIALLWVFLGYKSDMHNLKRLLYLCACFSAKPKDHFLNNETNGQLLNLMMQSYSHARYKENFSIDSRVATKLFDLVEGFVQLAKQLTESRIQELEMALSEDRIEEEASHG